MVDDLKKMRALRQRTLQPGRAPQPEETYDTLNGGPRGDDRDRVAGRDKQFNVRVADWFQKRVRLLKKRERATLGEILEATLAAYEANGGGLRPGQVPVEDARAKRTNEVRFYATAWVQGSIGRIAAERGLSVSELMEDLLARDLSASDTFQAVLQAPSALPATYELSGWVETLEERDDTGCLAHVRIRLLFVRVPERGTRQVLFEDSLTGDQACTRGDAGSFAEAMSHAVQQLSEDLRTRVVSAALAPATATP